jgi:Fic family protein
MDNMVRFMNDDLTSDLDALVKMAVIHHQFESIHPFYDGNGRTGRILNILYLVMQDLLDLPILYLSRFVINNKGDYYRLLQKVRDTGEWEEWIIYILRGIEETAKETIVLITRMRGLMQDYKARIRKSLPKMYSQDLLNNIFRHPYTKIEFIMAELMVSRLTATKYAELLVLHGFLVKEKIGRSNFYVNMPLFMLFKNDPEIRQETPKIQTMNPDFN